jgi:hypothetical protein
MYKISRSLMLDDLMMSQSIDVERQTTKEARRFSLILVDNARSLNATTYQNAITTIPYIERTKAIHFVIPCSCRKSEK